MTSRILKAPFPWFGGKSRVAHIVWERFGNVRNYVEPFFGSGAVLLGRPHEPRIETINDKDGYVANAWRAIAMAPEETADQADWPVNENDLHARHKWLISQKENLVERLENDPGFYDAKIAGWWLWGISIWIGGEFCVKAKRQKPHLGDAGIGVQRRRPHLKGGTGVQRGRRENLREYFSDLSDRLRVVRVCCGDWSRIMGPSPTIHNGLTGVFLDPPYSGGIGRKENMYSVEDLDVATVVHKWAVDHGDDHMLRIAMCGYEGEHKFPDEWTCVAWKSQGGYGPNNGNEFRERIWFSPACLKKPLQRDWLDGLDSVGQDVCQVSRDG